MSRLQVLPRIAIAAAAVLVISIPSAWSGTGDGARRESLCLCQAEYSADACPRMAANEFNAGRRHREVLRFVVEADGARTFTRAIQNVTPDDDVFVSILNMDPKAFAFEVGTSEVDSPTVVSVGWGDVDAAAVGKLIAAMVKVGGSAKEASGMAAKGAQDGAGVMAAAQAPASVRNRALAFGVEGGDLLKNLSVAQLSVLKKFRDSEDALLVDGERWKDIVARTEALDESVKALVNDLDDLERAADASGATRRLVLTGAQAGLAQADREIKTVTDRLNAVQVDLALITPSPEAVALTLRLAHLSREMEGLRSASRDLGAALQKALEPASAEACVALGRFDPGKRVSVKIAVKDVAPPKPGSVQLTRALEEANKILSAALTRAATAPPAAGDMEAAKEASPEKKGQESRTKGDAEGAEEKPAPKKRDLDTFTFDVLDSVHVQVGFAFPVSRLKNPTYELRRPLDTAAPAARSATSADASEGSDTATPAPLVPVETGDTRFQIRPTLMLALHLGRYFPRVEADSDPTESVLKDGRARRLSPFIAFGVGVQDIGADYFAGLGTNLGRSVQLIVGAHSGRVTRLVDGLEAGKSFVPSKEGFQVTDATRTIRGWGLFVALSIEPSLITKLFGGGGT